MSHTVLMKSSLTQMPSKKGRHTSLSVKCFCLSFSSPAPTSPSNKEGEEKRKNRKSNDHTPTTYTNNSQIRMGKKHPLVSLKVIARSHFLAQGMLKLNLMAILTVFILSSSMHIHKQTGSKHAHMDCYKHKTNSKWWQCACFNYEHNENRTQLTSIFLPSLHW